ncbi:Uncharacterised protein [Actinobacillus seminis]|uniref:Uncharacterized protein n=1 Tax=Actinobacillus seminis TaxID=722 RepID=A0A380VBL4_9PAST|nr:Uncharacterised protein [Actinobacillus seminis]
MQTLFIRMLVATMMALGFSLPALAANVPVGVVLAKK